MIISALSTLALPMYAGQVIDGISLSNKEEGQEILNRALLSLGVGFIIVAIIVMVIVGRW